MAVAVALVLAVAVLSLRLWLSIVYEGLGTRNVDLAVHALPKNARNIGLACDET